MSKGSKQPLPTLKNCKAADATFFGPYDNSSDKTTFGFWCKINNMLKGKEKVAFGELDVGTI